VNIGLLLDTFQIKSNLLKAEGPGGH